MPVVVVESPAKAKTINKYLGTDYSVFASYGHVRDLPQKMDQLTRKTTLRCYGRYLLIVKNTSKQYQMP